MRARTATDEAHCSKVMGILWPVGCLWLLFREEEKEKELFMNSEVDFMISKDHMLKFCLWSLDYGEELCTNAEVPSS